jgi:hypothetical protein
MRGGPWVVLRVPHSAAEPGNGRGVVHTPRARVGRTARPTGAARTTEK